MKIKQKKNDGQRHSFGGQRPFKAGGPKNFGHRRPSGAGRNPQKRREVKNDFSKFINKAVVGEEVEVFKPAHSFADFAINQRLRAAVLERGFTEPTPIQDQAIPYVLQGQDVVGLANTGTGKTGAFLIPLLNRVMLDARQLVMIIAPTRELALQIEEEFKALACGMRIFSVACVGGMNINPQIKALRRQYNFIIGTPGRIKDLASRRLIDLSRIDAVVLDEADRMLDMGFIGDMRFLLGQMPRNRQTLFFSATLSPSIEKLIHDFLRQPVKISVKTRDTSANVEQDIVKIGVGQAKIDVLSELLASDGLSKVLIFGRTKYGVEKLSKVLNKRGFAAESIHGNKNHNHRQRALKLFKEDQVRILVATDVAARGLDIADVSHVINYDLPETYEDYTHRIGRTGRAGNMGKALTFVE